MPEVEVDGIKFQILMEEGHTRLLFPPLAPEEMPRARALAEEIVLALRGAEDLECKLLIKQNALWNL